MARPAKRSPLKSIPLRLPGQSVQDEMDRVYGDTFLDSLALLTLTGAMFMTAVIQWWFPTPPLTLVMTTSVFFGGALIYSVPRMRAARRKLKYLKQGRDGERAVAECLDQLRETGAKVLHDLQGEKFNLDHVVVGRTGIYAVETKTISKPIDSDAKIVYDGEKVVLGRFQPSRNPVVQASAQANWLRQLLYEAVGKEYSIRPVVVFPGWFVERASNYRKSQVWVLEPKALVKFIQNEPAVLSDAEISTISFFLKRYVRNGEG